MTTAKATKATKATKAKTKPAEPKAVRTTKADTLIALMRADGGATAQVLAEAVGWQLHSVRGFIAGNLKKRTDLQVTATRIDGVTRYSVTEVPSAGAASTAGEAA